MLYLRLRLIFNLTDGMLYNCDMHNFYAIIDLVQFVLWTYHLRYIIHSLRLLYFYKLKISLRASNPEGHLHST